jgi:hypothetical protein
MAYSIKYNNIQFNIYDYTGTNTLSTYTLDITPLTFVPDFTTSTLSSSQIISNKLIHWDFGDGTYANTLTATHRYQWPGSYNIKLTIYDNNGEAYDSSFNPTIQVYDFVPTTLTWQEYLSASVLSTKYMGPFYVNTFNSWQSYPALSATGYTINFYASGAGGEYLTATNYNTSKWTHLRTLSQFFVYQVNFNAEQYVAVDSLTANQTIIYANIQDNQLQVCGPNDPGATIAGTSGYCEIYYADDSIKDIINSTKSIVNPIHLFATIDSSKFNDFFTQRTNLYNYVSYPEIGYQNLAPAVISIQRGVTEFDPATAIAISTTGITGEGTLASSVSSIFNIPDICWQNTEIPYVITLKDINNFTTKFYPPLSSAIANKTSSNYSSLTALTAYNVNIGAVAIDGYGNIFPQTGFTFTEDFISPGAVQQLGSFYKGYFVANTTGTGYALSASVVVVDPITHLAVTLSGTSNTFSVYTTAGQYNICKINENWDMSGYYSSLRFQEPLLDYDNFFIGFLGGIVGDINSYPYELGKTVYEKIANFVSNRSDIDNSNVDTLLSFCDELSIQFELYNYNYPPQLRRIIDLLSVKQQKLWGNQNTYNTNFNNNTQLYTDRSIGPNLGTLIDPISGKISVTTPIVAYELFSGNYTLVNYVSSYYLSTSATNGLIPLSSYTPDWGWGLIVPNSVTGRAVSNYYSFYTYNSAAEGSFYDNLINWNDSHTTLLSSQNDYNAWSSDNGVMQNIISYNLTRGLGLFLTPPSLLAPTLEVSALPANQVYTVQSNAIYSLLGNNIVTVQ